jgi:hypothetical protein
MRGEEIQDDFTGDGVWAQVTCVVQPPRVRRPVRGARAVTRGSLTGCAAKRCVDQRTMWKVRDQRVRVKKWRNSSQSAAARSDNDALSGNSAVSIDQ